MSYCVNCGVELDKGEKHCPLCNTPVINPNCYDEVHPKPEKEYEQLPHIDIDFKYMSTIISILLLIPISVSIICNMVDSGRLTWSLYVVGAIALTFIIALLPAFLKKKNPYLLEAVDVVGIALYLCLVNRLTGGKWFLGFALPLCFLTLVCVMLCTLAVRCKISPLLRVSTFIIFAGLYALAVEIIINDYHNAPLILHWSHFVLIPCAAVAIVLLFIDSQKKLKDELKKRLFM